MAPPDPRHVAHDAAVLGPHHEAADQPAVVRHVRAQTRPHRLHKYFSKYKIFLLRRADLELLSAGEEALQRGDLLWEAAGGGEVLHAEVGAQGLHDVPRQVHVVSLHRDYTASVHTQAHNPGVEIFFCERSNIFF